MACPDDALPHEDHVQIDAVESPDDVFEIVHTRLKVCMGQACRREPLMPSVK